jgi:hypothetical protein
MDMVMTIKSFKENNLVIILNDASNDLRYVNFRGKKDIVYLTTDINRGKKLYWETVTILLRKVKEYEYKKMCMLADDFVFSSNFEKELNLFKFGILKTFTYSSGPNWGYDDWVDGAFICDEEFLEALDYTIPNTFIDDFTGSGVGKYMSRIIDEYGFIVDYRGALLKHIGNDDSKLNPKIRKKQPLKDDENEWK